MTTRSLPALAFFSLACALVVTPAPVFAQQARPESVAALLRCRSIATEAARLQCYDTAAAAFEAQEHAGDLVIVDRAELRATERQLFGFSLPSLPLLSRSTSAPMEQLTATLTAASQQGSGKWQFRLSDGSVWRQTDSQAVRPNPRAGAETTVRRAAMGSFMLNLGVGRSIRVERVQ